MTRRYRHDPDGARLPVKIDTTSNGEFTPQPLKAYEEIALEAAQAAATENAARRGEGRRDYMVSASAVAATLLALNDQAQARGRTGGFYALSPETALDEAAAAEVVEGGEFVFDVQNHAVNPNGPWRERPGAEPYRALARKNSPHSAEPGEYDYLNYMDGEHYIKDVFLDSDTDVAAMSVHACDDLDEPLAIEDAAAIRTLADRLGQGRLLLHGKALPNFPGDLEKIVALKERWGVSAWKVYTQLGPEPGAPGYSLDDEAVMTPFIERSRALGVRIICAHKGLPFTPHNYAQSTARDVGAAARLYPDMQFLVYHAGYELGRSEGAFDPDHAEAGVDALVKSLIDNGIAPNTNVYAELGAIWRRTRSDPEEAAHCWGKLLKYVGEDNVLWGTDCTWAGSPQDQIQTFRAFQISEEFQERFGYPALTPALKAKILGLNAARVYGVEPPARQDLIARRRRERREEPDPSFVTHGPKTPAELAAMRAASPISPPKR
jgi:predicted TIM-barrel fold metal-dependent hydrolase